MDGDTTEKSTISTITTDEKKPPLKKIRSSGKPAPNKNPHMNILLHRNENLNAIIASFIRNNKSAMPVDENKTPFVYGSTETVYAIQSAHTENHTVCYLTRWLRLLMNLSPETPKYLVGASLMSVQN